MRIHDPCTLVRATAKVSCCLIQRLRGMPVLRCNRLNMANLASDELKRNLRSKMVMSDMSVMSEAKQMEVSFVRLWFEKHLSRYGAFVPTGEGEFIIEFPLPMNDSLCDSSQIPTELEVNGVRFFMNEIGMMYEMLNEDIVEED